MSPDDPISPLRAGAASAHEVFLSLMEAGFTERQALQITAYLIVNTEEKP